jgi:hypothetical protein
MSTPAQAAASRANGAQSQGPVTPEGKTASSQNALRHGLRSAAVLIPGEDPAEFDRHVAAYIHRFKPADAPERDLVEAIAGARWRLKRLGALEATLLQDEELPLVRALGVVTRYEGQLNRTYDRALQQLQDLQNNRPEELKSAPAASFRTPKPNEPGEREVFALLDALTAPPRASAPANLPSTDQREEMTRGNHK